MANDNKYFSKPQDITDLYRRYTGSSSISRSISLRSVKRDIDRSREKKEGAKEIYDKVMIMNDRGHDPQYINLYNVLQGYKQKVIPINR